MHSNLALEGGAPRPDAAVEAPPLPESPETQANAAELRERARLAEFLADVGAALARGRTLPASLQQCCEAMVRHLGGDFASVWTVRPKGDLLDLQADAGVHASRLTRPVTIPVGSFRIGRVAQDRQPLLVDLTTASVHEDDKDWAARAGLVAFAGYPLVVGERIVGVMAMYARKPLTQVALHLMGAVADQIALGIDRDRATEAVRASEERIRSLVANMLVGVITIDGAGVIESANAAAEAMFGYEPGELLGAHFTALVPKSKAAHAEHLLRRLYRRAIGRVTEWRGRRKDGQVFPLELTLFEFLTPEGRRLAGCVRDLSERHELERMKAEFTATVSHELRTPLTCVIGYLDLLHTGNLGEMPEPARDAIAKAQAAALRLQALTEDVLDLARADAGRLKVTLEPVAMAEVVQASLESVQALADRDEIVLEADAPAGVALADRERLIQVLVNLLSNAIKFSPQGSRVTVSVREARSYVEVRVQDRGRGIPVAHRSPIFERFRQVDASYAHRKAGAGLGLAICKAIIEEHQGTIGVDSAEGEGSTFWFRVPSASAQARVVALRAAR